MMFDHLMRDGNLIVAVPREVYLRASWETRCGIVDRCNYKNPYGFQLMEERAGVSQLEEDNG